MKDLYIVGAGGFGREVHAWVLQHPDQGVVWKFAGFLDDNAKALEKFGNFAKIFSLTAHRVSQDSLYLCGLAIPAVKAKLLTPLIASEAKFINFIHPSAIIGERIKFGMGCVVCPGVIVSADVTCGDFVVLNLRTTVGHDATIGSWSTASAHCDITGNVAIEDKVFLGSRASVIPGRTIGAGSKVGAGAVVFSNVPPNVTVVGNPARIL